MSTKIEWTHAPGFQGETWTPELSERFWKQIAIRPSGCWEWTAGTFTSGYGQFRVGKKKMRTHRLMWELIRGAIPEAKMVMHRCDNPPCCRPSHLRLGTHQNNMEDRNGKGRQAVGLSHPSFGERNGSAKLTEEDVHKIHTLRQRGWTLEQIAHEFPIGKSQIGNIIRGESWRTAPK